MFIISPHLTDLSSENGTMEIYDPYLTTPFRAILIATYGPIFLIGTMGNLLVIYVIAHNRSMQTVTNFFLANLAVADLLVSLCCVIPKLLWFILKSWTLGSFICRLHQTMISLTTNASIFILTIISAERFIAIVYPFETKQILTSRRLFVAVVGVWCLSAILSSPTAYFHEIVEYAGNSYCSTKPMAYQQVAHIHTTLLFFLCFLCPLIVMSILYLKIARRLWTRNCAGKLGMVSRNNYNYTRKVSVDAILDKADINGLREADSPLVTKLDLSYKTPCDDDNDVEFGPNHVDNIADDIDDVPAIITDSPSGHNIKIGPFFLDEPDGEDESLGDSKTDPRWKLTKDPPMGLIKLDMKHVKFGLESSEIKGVQMRSESQESLEGLLSSPNGQPGHDTLDKSSDTNIPTRPAVSPSPCARLAKKQSSIDSPFRDSPLAIVSGGNTATTSISCKIARRKKKRNAKAVMIARKKVIRLLIIMLVAFALCLFPMQLILFWSHYGQFPHDTVAGALLIPLAYAAYFFNSALNPFLYAFLSDNFRTKMKETLCIPSTKTRGVHKIHKKVRNTASEAFTESEWTHSLHLTTDASLHV